MVSAMAQSIHDVLLALGATNVRGTPSQPSLLALDLELLDVRSLFGGALTGEALLEVTSREAFAFQAPRELAQCGPLWLPGIETVEAISQAIVDAHEALRTRLEEDQQLLGRLGLTPRLASPDPRARADVDVDGEQVQVAVDAHGHLLLEAIAGRRVPSEHRRVFLLGDVSAHEAMAQLAEHMRSVLARGGLDDLADGESEAAAAVAFDVDIDLEPRLPDGERAADQGLSHGQMAEMHAALRDGADAAGELWMDVGDTAVPLSSDDDGEFHSRTASLLTEGEDAGRETVARAHAMLSFSDDEQSVTGEVSLASLSIARAAAFDGDDPTTNLGPVGFHKRKRASSLVAAEFLAAQFSVFDAAYNKPPDYQGAAPPPLDPAELASDRSPPAQGSPPVLLTVEGPSLDEPTRGTVSQEAESAHELAFSAESDDSLGFGDVRPGDADATGEIDERQHVRAVVSAAPTRDIVSSALVVVAHEADARDARALALEGEARALRERAELLRCGAREPQDGVTLAAVQAAIGDIAPFSNDAVEPAPGQRHVDQPAHGKRGETDVFETGWLLDRANRGGIGLVVEDARALDRLKKHLTPRFHRLLEARDAAAAAASPEVLQVEALVFVRPRPDDATREGIVQICTGTTHPSILVISSDARFDEMPEVNLRLPLEQRASDVAQQILQGLRTLGVATLPAPPDT